MAWAPVSFGRSERGSLNQSGWGPATPAPVVLRYPHGVSIRAVTPYLVIKGAAAAIDWYGDVFGAVEITRWHDPDGRISHAEIRLGGVPIFLADEHPEFEHIVGPLTLGGSPVLLDLDVDDVDELFARAVAAGATPVRPPDHPTSGVQAAKIADPFGHIWLLTHEVG